MKDSMPVALSSISAIPAGVKARRQAKVRLLRSIIASMTIDSAPNRLRQNSTTQMSTGTMRAKNPEVLQAIADASTRTMPTIALRPATCAAELEGALVWPLIRRALPPYEPPGTAACLPQRPIQCCQQPFDLAIVIVVGEA